MFITNLEVCACLQQRGDRLGGLAIAGSVMERGGAFVVSGVYVGAGVEQGSEDGMIVVPDSPVERGLLAVIARFKVSACGYQYGNDFRLGRVMESSPTFVIRLVRVSACVDQCLDDGGAGT